MFPEGLTLALPGDGLNSVLWMEAEETSSNKEKKDKDKEPATDTASGNASSTDENLTAIVSKQGELTLQVVHEGPAYRITPAESVHLVLYSNLEQGQGELLVKVKSILITGSCDGMEALLADGNQAEPSGPGQLSITLKKDEYLVLSGGTCTQAENQEITIEGSKQDPVQLTVQTGSLLEARFESAYEGQCAIAQYDGYPITQGAQGLPVWIWWGLSGFLLLLALVFAVLNLRARRSVKRLNRKLQESRSQIALLPRDPGPEQQTGPVYAEKTQLGSQAALSNEQTEYAPQSSFCTLSVGKLQNIGRRPSQQDSYGIMPVGTSSVLAVVADGMGGLSDGDRVSQQIVRSMVRDASQTRPEHLFGNLRWLVGRANSDVNQLLGHPDRYVSGSTLVAVLAEPNRFQWISVGDSRIYLFRGGALLQLNREHIYEVDLLGRAVNGELSFQEAREHAKRKSVSSFVGMGELKYVDEPLRPITARPGDRVLLSSDGVFNALTEDEIVGILSAYPNPNEAAAHLEEAVLRKALPYQDNFTAIVIAYQ